MRKHVTESQRRDAALGVETTVERAAGFGVWVKGGPHLNFPTMQVASEESAPQVLALPDSYDNTLAAIETYARRNHLQPELLPEDLQQGLRSCEIILRQENEFVLRWRVREVPRLLRAAIVIDDLGQDLDSAQTLLRQPYPLTFSILPALRFSSATAREAHGAGREVMLHLPMEPEPGSGANPGPGAIRTGMGGDEVAAIIREDLTSVPFATGANNHMGSRATVDAALMLAVMKVLENHSLFFVDSRTTAGSEALNAARRVGIPAFYRSVFLDDTETVEYTRQQLRLFCRVVDEQGEALAIGHPHASTIKALEQFLPEFERQDIQLVPASQLARSPEAARLEPPRGNTRAKAQRSAE